MLGSINGELTINESENDIGNGNNNASLGSIEEEGQQKEIIKPLEGYREVA